MNRLQAIILTLLLPSFLLASCAKIIEPEFRRVENFQIKKAGLQEVTLAFGVVWFNPNKFGVTVKDADIDVYLDSVYIGKFTQPSETVVNSQAEFSIPVEGRVGLANALKLDLTNLVGRQVYIQARGNIKIGKGGVYINRPVFYEGKEVIDASLIK